MPAFTTFLTIKTLTNKKKRKKRFYIFAWVWLFPYRPNRFTSLRQIWTGGLRKAVVPCQNRIIL